MEETGAEERGGCMREYFDNPLDLRFVKRYNDASGILLYTVRVDVGGLLSREDHFSCVYEGREYTFDGIDIVGFKRYKETYVYYIEFMEVRYDYVEVDGDETDGRSETNGARALSRTGRGGPIA